MRTPNRTHKPNQTACERLRVCVADATRLNSELIAAALTRSRNNFDVRPLKGTSSEVCAVIENTRPHVVVISSELADGPLTGFKVLHQFRASNVKTPAVILLDSAERELVVNAFQAGARGIFSRGSSMDDLPKCIRRVHEGQIWISNTELEFLLEIVLNVKVNHAAQDRRKRPLLTPRERDVIRLVAEGMRNQEIGAALNLGEHTVRNYIFRVFDKLGLSSRVELVLYALSSENSFGDQPSLDLARGSARVIPLAREASALANRR